MALLTMPSLVGLTWPLTRRGPIFDTAKEVSVSGRTARYPRRITPRWQWELNFDAIFQGYQGGAPSGGNADFTALAGFFAQLYGGAYPFQYLAAEDSAVTGQSLGTGDGATRAFQLVRTLGGFTEKVNAPNAVSVYVNGTLKTPGADYTLSASGLVTFVAAPAAGAAVTWTGTYYWVCEFDDDLIEFEQIMSGVYQVKKLTFTSKIL
jgi:uncharacterized protein (TIGR02217 family)